MRIGLRVDSLNLTDEDEAVYQYGTALQGVGIDVDILTYKKNPFHTQKGVERMQKNLSTRFYIHLDEVEKDYQAIYTLESGVPSVRSFKAPLLVHANNIASTPFGTRYCAVSEWLAKRDDCSRFVPFIVPIPVDTTNLRRKLKIPKGAVVIGRCGRWQDFTSLPYVRQSLVNCLSKNENLYLLLENVDTFVSHPRAIYVNQTYGRTREAFINTCDVFIDADNRGETFGLIMGQFSIAGCPILMYENPINKAHFQLLKGKDTQTFINEFELESSIDNYCQKGVVKRKGDWSQYEVSPVMKKFLKEFVN